MNWEEFCLARLLMAEERIGRAVREHDRAELEREQQGQDVLRSRGLVR
jgi:hypothetical protein